MGHRCIYTEKPLQNTLYYKACTSTSQYYFVLESLHKVLPSTTLYHKAYTEYFPVQSLHKVLPSTTFLVTTKLAQSNSRYYFVLQELQSLHKAGPSTTLYYKACTKYFHVLLCTTKLARSTSPYYFVLQSLHRVLPSTTLYYKACKGIPVLLCTAKLAQVLASTTLYCKACTTHFPVALGTTKLAQSTSQYHFVLRSSHQYNFVLHSFHKTLPFVLQSLHKVPCTTLYYKACTKPVPVILGTTKLAQRTSQHYFVLQSLHTTLPKTHQALTHSKLFHTASFYTQQAFTTQRTR